MKTPLMFIGATSVTAPTRGNDFLDNIVHRICKHFDLQSLSEFNSVPRRKNYAYDALFRAHLIEWRTEEIRKLADDFYSHSRKHHDAFTTWNLLEDGVLLGYFWAKAECDSSMKPLAESAIRVKARSSFGGSKSGDARRKKRSSTWEPNAKRMAKSIREKKPSLSQDNVATAIILEWPDQNSGPPGHATLKNLISRMEALGELPRKQRAR